MSIHLFGLLQRRFTAKETHQYIVHHWQDWFPCLPSYQAYNHRLNKLHWQFEVLVEDLTRQLCYSDCYADVCLTDSLPIIVSKRPYQAKVARPIADKGYCATKRLYYHGLKLHFLGRDRYKGLPQPELLHLSAASASDLTELKPLLPKLTNRKVIADKIYASAPLNEQLASQRVEIITPVKLKPGQKQLDAADTLFARFVSSVRQPVEAFFHWLNEKTHIPIASKVRSAQGLFLHCYGRLAAALFILVNP